jgi:hypothetical protein
MAPFFAEWCFASRAFALLRASSGCNRFFASSCVPPPIGYLIFPGLESLATTAQVKSIV